MNVRIVKADTKSHNSVVNDVFI